MKQLCKLLWQTLAIRSISSIFNHDAHNIVSEKGWEKLAKDEETIRVKPRMKKIWL